MYTGSIQKKFLFQQKLSTICDWWVCHNTWCEIWRREKVVFDWLTVVGRSYRLYVNIDG